MSTQSLILASGSAIRAKILTGAGLEFSIVKPGVDEGAIKKRLLAEEAALEEIALALAEAKALALSPPGALVIGSDQILEFKGEPYDKPANLAEAKARLLEMQGEAHSLINAVAVAENGRVVFRHIDRPRLFMRRLGADEIDNYLALAGEEILSSVGAYQIESIGSRLFERIEGDHFAVLGLALFPLLDFLRGRGIGGF